jgi:hypothetical protein
MNAAVDQHEHPLNAHSRRLWLAILLAGSAWMLQELAGWLLSEFACANANLSAGAFNAGTLRVTQVVIAVAALVLALIALSMGVRSWRSMRHASQGGAPITPRGLFVAALSMGLSAAFTIGVAFATVGPLLLPLCERGR